MKTERDQNLSIQALLAKRQFVKRALFIVCPLIAIYFLLTGAFFVALVVTPLMFILAFGIGRIFIDLRYTIEALFYAHNLEKSKQSVAVANFSGDKRHPAITRWLFAFLSRQLKVNVDD